MLPRYISSHLLIHLADSSTSNYRSFGNPLTVLEELLAKLTSISIMPEVYSAHPDYGFPRNFKGYGEKGLEGLKWPNDSKIAVSFVINYEEVRLGNHRKFLL